MTSSEVLYQRFLECSEACTDSRNVVPGSLFFALKGPNFNANAFALQALDSGARYAVVDDPSIMANEKILLVHDVLRSLQDLARYHRSQKSIPIVAITGSNGKTTTKELVHAVMNADRPTLATTGNLNNHIGVPLTLLGISDEHRIAIIEMGANKPGDIAELVNIAEPTHGLITNIGKAHLEGFGGFEGVIATKCELYTYIREHKGTLLVNADDALLMEKCEGVMRITYGTSPTAVTSGRSLPDGPFMHFELNVRGGQVHRVDTHLIGSYNLTNALAAVAIGRQFGVPDDRIVNALSDYRPGNNRSQFSDTGRNTLILDAYNANPTSMLAALENFVTMASERPKLAILGDMLELGDASDAEHAAILEQVERSGLEAVFVGPEFQRVSRKTSFEHYADVDSLRAAMEKSTRTGHLILVKGSRGIRLEKLIEVL